MSSPPRPLHDVYANLMEWLWNHIHIHVNCIDCRSQQHTLYNTLPVPSSMFGQIIQYLKSVEGSKKKRIHSNASENIHCSLLFPWKKSCQRCELHRAYPADRTKAARSTATSSALLLLLSIFFMALDAGVEKCNTIPKQEQ